MYVLLYVQAVWTVVFYIYTICLCNIRLINLLHLCLLVKKNKLSYKLI